MTDDAGERTALVLGLNKTYGKHAARVMAQARLPAALIAVAPVASSLEPAQLVNLTAAAAAKKEDLPELTPDGRSAVEKSDILRAAKAVSNVMYRSGEQRAFAAKMADALENYARLGGDVNALDNKFTTLDSGNLRILMPQTLEFDGLTSALHDATLELKASVPAGKDAAGKREALKWAAAYENGYWIFDGADGFSFVDAATGKEIAHRSIAELKTSASSAYEGLD